MNNQIENFPKLAYERFAAEARLTIKKQAKKIDIHLTNDDIKLINKASLVIFKELIKESIESERFFTLEGIIINQAIDRVWFEWNSYKRLAA